MMRITSLRTRVWSPLAAWVLVVALGVRIPDFVADSDFYAAMATGDRSLVPAPFSQRVGLPYLARIGIELGASAPVSFTVLAVVLLLCSLFLLRVLLRDLTDLEFLLVVLVPFSVFQYQEAYLPDLLFSTLLAGLLYVLARRGSTWAPLLIVPMFLVRESVLLVGVILAVVAWRTGRRRAAGVALGATAAGYVVGGLLALGGAATRYGVSGPLYLAAKVPYNGLKNLAGFEFFTDQSPVCQPLVTFPPPVRLGSITEVGLCPFAVDFPAVTLASWLTLFGVMPTVGFVLARRHVVARRELWMRVAWWSGLVAFVAAPLLGASVRRLAGYGWPAMMLVVPILLALAVDSRVRLRVLALSLVTAWVPVAIGSVAGDRGDAALVTIAIAVPLHVLGYLVLRSGRRTSPVTGTATDPRRADAQ